MPARPAPSLGDVLARVEAAVGYLRASTTITTTTTTTAAAASSTTTTTTTTTAAAASTTADITTDSVAGVEHFEWLSCAELIAEPRRLADVIGSTMVGRGTQQESVAASLFVQSYAFRIGALVLAPYALGLAIPSCAPPDTFVRMTRHRPGGVAVTDPAVEDRSVDQLVGSLLGQHLAPLIATTTSVITIGRRLLWGNVAASCAAVFRAIDGSDGVDRAAVQRRAEVFLAAANSWLKGLGWFETITATLDPMLPIDQWRWQRTNCCLYYQCAGATKCDDCSLDRIAEIAPVAATNVALTGGSVTDVAVSA